jgi:hypothetical protein
MSPKGELKDSERPGFGFNVFLGLVVALALVVVVADVVLALL